MRRKQPEDKGNGREPRATKMVSIYWTPEFVERLDRIAEQYGRTRNDFIKEAVGNALVAAEGLLISAGRID